MVKNFNYKDVDYLCKSVTISEIENKNFNLFFNKFIKTKEIKTNKKLTENNLQKISKLASKTDKSSLELQKLITSGLKKGKLDHLRDLNFVSMQLDQLHKFSSEIFNYFFIDNGLKNKKFKHKYEIINKIALIKDCLHSKKPDENLLQIKYY